MIKKFAFFLLVPSVFLIDRFLKTWIIRHYPAGEGFPVLPGVFHITRVDNTGAAFGVFRGATAFLVVVSVVSVFFLLFYLVRKILREDSSLVPGVTDWAWALVIGGALGNLYDRVRYGYVIDFLDFRIWPVFNVADICICVGVFLIILKFAGRPRWRRALFPVVFQWGSFTVYSYGALTALGVFLCYVLARQRASHFGLERDAASNLIVFLFIWGVIGSRLFYVVQNPAGFRENWWHVFFIQEGGLVWYGGFITAALAGIVYAKKHGWPVLKISDLFASLLPLGHAFGRLGCFFNGCCYGRFADSLCSVLFPGDIEKRIPVQLYEAGFLFLLFIFLSIFSFRNSRPGRVLASYLVLYGLLRFGVEFMRVDQPLIGIWTLAQWTSLGLIASGSFLFLFTQKKGLVSK